VQLSHAPEELITDKHAMDVLLPYLPPNPSAASGTALLSQLSTPNSFLASRSIFRLASTSTLLSLHHTAAILKCFGQEEGRGDKDVDADQWKLDSEQEAQAYHFFLQHLQGSAVPRIHGIYEITGTRGPVGRYLLMENAGEALTEKGLRALSEEDRCVANILRLVSSLITSHRLSLFDRVVQVAKAGVLSDDFAARNVLRRPTADFCLIDFSWVHFTQDATEQKAWAAEIGHELGLNQDQIDSLIERHIACVFYF
jgi:hypothetical protein